MTDDVPTSIRIPKDTWAALQIVAKSMDRTTPQLIREILRKWLKRKERE